MFKFREFLQTWWHIPLILAFERERQAYLHEFRASLIYIMRTYLKKKWKFVIWVIHNEERIKSLKEP